MCLVESLLSVAEVFAWQVLNPKSDLLGIDEVVESRKVFIEAAEPIFFKEKG